MLLSTLIAVGFDVLPLPGVTDVQMAAYLVLGAGALMTKAIVTYAQAYAQAYPAKGRIWVAGQRRPDRVKFQLDPDMRADTYRAWHKGRIYIPAGVVLDVEYDYMEPGQHLMVGTRVWDYNQCQVNFMNSRWDDPVCRS